MRHEIIFAPEAVEDLRRLSARDRSTVKADVERHLRHDAEKVSRGRIKRLRGLSRPQYRLRVGDIRVFYDVNAEVVEILAIVPKPHAAVWLEEIGEKG